MTPGHHIVNTLETLSKDAEATFSVIRTHPGIEGRMVGLELGFETSRLSRAINQLLDHKLIDVKLEPRDNISKEGRCTNFRLYTRI